MSILVKHSGVWKEPSTIYVRHSGVWKDPGMIYVRHLGVWKEVGGPKLPSLGESIGGGFYFGSITVGSNKYALIIADKAAESALQWKINQSSSGTSSTVDGWTNTISLNNTSHPAGKYCRDYQGGGFNDWYLPALNELYQMYSNLRPSGGSTPALFKTGGAQAMVSSIYWTSTEAAGTHAWTQRFDDGNQTSQEKDSVRLIRPVRRINVNDL